MTSTLNGKFAVVTGGTQGLGEATARLFAERGAAGILITGRNAQRGQAVARDLTAGGCDGQFVQAELTDIAACQRIISTAAERFGAIHVLVNAAALTERGSIWDTSPELFDRVMQINVRAPFFLMQDAIKLMERNNNEGSIINITSVAAEGGTPFLTAYSTSKAALVALTKNVAYSVMRSRIRVNAINLGWMDTPGEDDIQRRFHGDDRDWLSVAEAGMPFGRLIKPTEAARTVAYLASEESGMMTGAILDFDQSVIGAWPQPIPPPREEWPKVTGVSYS